MWFAPELHWGFDYLETFTVLTFTVTWDHQFKGKKITTLIV